MEWLHQYSVVHSLLNHTLVIIKTTEIRLIVPKKILNYVGHLDWIFDKLLDFRFFLNHISRHFVKKWQQVDLMHVFTSMCRILSIKNLIKLSSWALLTDLIPNLFLKNSHKNRRLTLIWIFSIAVCLISSAILKPNRCENLIDLITRHASSPKVTAGSRGVLIYLSCMSFKPSSVKSSTLSSLML